MPVYKKNFKGAQGLKEYNSKLSQYTQEQLELSKIPVGIQFFYTEEEFLESNFEETHYKMSYCVYVKKASEGKAAFKTVLKNHYCDGATTAFGLELPNLEITSGRTYFSYGLYETKAIAQKVWKEVPAFPANGIELYGVAIAPLKDFDVEPDIVIIIGDSLQMMKIVQGNMYKYGQRLNLNVSAMQAMCSEVTVIPYLTGEINISLMCPSTRMLAKWQSSELSAGIPYHKLAPVIEGVEDISTHTY